MTIQQEREPTREDVQEYVVGLLSEITADWDVEISSTTDLGSLGLESISLVYLIGEVQQRYGLRDVLFQRLRSEETSIMDLRVADVVTYVCETLHPEAQGAAGGAP